MIKYLVTYVDRRNEPDEIFADELRAVDGDLLFLDGETLVCMIARHSWSRVDNLDA